ncbi:uncharacterized protein LOC113919594 [Zalophus californianus]|uniref:Uncharacterized protein LOC113919594 n=1 Tax=Zalophus californianus TaxID=9704 RepID=A0A6J2CKC4_ZALCA|nr:uncharacterized protein LOC113919594 [Zalophus californianus]XP_027444770.1 uncharacterized protein LOC113919594 [Zalophus californianus]XP_027444771.1 uncharacterized protein LOC113919594 [Zalophus californianus]
MAVSGPRQHVTRARSALARPAAGRSQHRAGAAGPRPGCRNPPGTLSERQTRFLLLQSPKSGPAGSRPETASGDAGTRGERSRRVRRRPTPCGARPVTPALRVPTAACRPTALPRGGPQRPSPTHGGSVSPGPHTRRFLPAPSHPQRYSTPQLHLSQGRTRQIPMGHKVFADTQKKAPKGLGFREGAELVSFLLTCKSNLCGRKQDNTLLNLELNLNVI